MGNVETDFYFEMGILALALYVTHWRLGFIPQETQCVVFNRLCTEMKRLSLFCLVFNKYT